MIQPPSTHINYHISGAGIFWSDSDDSITVYDASSDDHISVSGIDADSIFCMCRNLMCARDKIFDNLKRNDSAMRYAAEMRNALTEFIESQESNEATV